ncbi:MAG: chromosome segregation protein ScpA [Nitrososphaeraceae archaeon]
MMDEGDKASLSIPPLNLLFNTSLLGKQNVWDIDIANLLELLLKFINSSGQKDLRICGIAAWSSSLIYRLKVESIFRLEKLSMEKKSYGSQNEEKEIPLLKLIDFPFRLSSTYPVSLEDLLTILENMINDLGNPKQKNLNQIKIEPLEDFDFDHYLVKFERILEEHEDYLMQTLEHTEFLLFSQFISKLENLKIARFFIALLHLAMKGKIDLIQQDDPIDIKVINKCYNQ